MNIDIEKAESEKAESKMAGSQKNRVRIRSKMSQFFQTKFSLRVQGKQKFPYVVVTVNIVKESADVNIINAERIEKAKFVNMSEKLPRDNLLILAIKMRKTTLIRQIIKYCLYRYFSEKE